MAGFKYIDGIKTNRMPYTSNIKTHVKDPVRYPNVQGGYEKLSQVIFAVQVDNMLQDLVKEMVDISKQ